jgi:hypothetical protein
MSGVYKEALDISVGGTEGKKITIRNYLGGEVTLSGKSFMGYGQILKIENKNHVTISGLQFKDYQKNGSKGILVIDSSDILILGNLFSNIDYSPKALGKKPKKHQNSQPIIVFGRDVDKSSKNIKIIGNVIYHCEVGWSECIAVNGNVDGFMISNNHLYNNTNIPIVAIGHEGECPEPSLDQARNGVIDHNLVHDNLGAYTEFGGIYVDGGKSIIIENNVSYRNNFGIEVGCENNGKAPNDPSASDIIIRNNLVYDNTHTGIALGGYDYPKGSGKVKNVIIANNTCYNNDTHTTYNGELLAFYVENSVVQNNIFYATNANKVVLVTGKPNPSLLFDYNTYYAPSGKNDVVFHINGKEYFEFSSYVYKTKQDTNSIFSDPLFKNSSSAKPDFHLSLKSPSINMGNPNYSPSPIEKDMDGEKRVADKIIDCGADEVQKKNQNQ